ncbi:MAG: VWA domain-containing protein [Planctomycetaceae bacterium]|nr:VWA domain-containing protein [Planctomycetaceae bacterium]
MKRFLVRVDGRDDAANGFSKRKGAFMVLAFFCLMTLMAFVTLCIDIGSLALEETKMQNAVDAAAMAAIIEINSSIATAGPDVEDVTAYAVSSARQVAANVALLNGSYIDPNLDVSFGRRTQNTENGQFQIQWGAMPANVVKVAARRDNADPTAPDAKVPVIFAGVFGNGPTELHNDAVAYVDARDIVAVIDFSASMCNLSLFKQESIDDLGYEAIENNLTEVFETLQPIDTGTMTETPKHITVYSPPSENEGDPVVDVTFKFNEITVNSDQPYQKIKLDYTDGTTQTLSVDDSSGTYSGTGNNANKDIDTAWVIFVQDVTITGASGSGCKPTISVTFLSDGTSVYIESSKDLSNVVLEFADGTHYKFDSLNQGKTGTFTGTGTNAGKQITGVWVKSGCNQSSDGPGYGERFDSPLTEQTSIAIEFQDNNENVLAYFNLIDVPYPYPSGSWNAFIDYVRSHTDILRGGYREMYGGITFAHYLLKMQSRANQTPDLWKTPHYPFHAVKLGVQDLVDYLDGLGFSDHVGLVSYDTQHRIECSVAHADLSIDISESPITGNYGAIKTIMDRKQAAEYLSSTNIAGGLWRAKELLYNHGRQGARPTILLMTDGVPNVAEPYTIPAGWNWNELFDYNRDGTADYSLSPSSPNYHTKMSTLVHAKLTADAGVTIHTLSVGSAADTELMKAIAWVSGGSSTHVPGGLAVDQLRSEISSAFTRLTALVPPPKLLSGE